MTAPITPSQGGGKVQCMHCGNFFVPWPGEDSHATLKARIEELEAFVRRTIQRAVTIETGYSVAKATRADARTALASKGGVK